MSAWPLFSILHTSARPDAWRKVYDAWISAAANRSDVEYVLCVDRRWGFTAQHVRDAQESGLVVVENETRYKHSGYVSGVNLAAKASHGQILIVVADDQFPCELWDQEILSVLGNEFDPDECGWGGPDFVVEVSTGTPDEHERGIMVMPILSRARYEKLGYVFYPEYESMFADNDFCEHARQDGVVIDARRLVFDHRHWMNSKRERDIADGAQNDSGAYRLGSEIIKRRRSTNFSSLARIYVNPEGTDLAVSPEPARRTVALCLAGEHFQGQWFDGILTLIFHLIQSGFDVVPIRGYTSNVYATREEIRKALLQVKPDLALWLDDDNICSPAHFDTLLADLDGRPDVDGVAGWCWIHPEGKERFQCSLGTFAPNFSHWKPFHPSFSGETELRQFECGGMPCFLMRFSAVEKAGDEPFVRGIVDSPMMRGVGGEDLAFFRSAQQGGALFLADPRVRVPHLKYVTVEPTFVEEGLPEPKIAVMMRVKNEARWIRRAIESVTTYGPEALGPVFVLDDGSTDATPLIAARCGATVFSTPFQGRELDERRDKNWLLDQVKERCNPDFVLCIDGDEELERGGIEKIRRACQTAIRDGIEVFALRFLYLWDKPDQARFDGRYSSLCRASLFRVLPFTSFLSFEGQEGTNEGLHIGNAPRPPKGCTLEIAPLNVNLIHWGYLFAADRMRKYQWYNRIDPNNESEDCYQHIIQGDQYGPSFSEKLKHAGPMDLRTLPKSIAPVVSGEEFAEMNTLTEPWPGPIVDIGERRRPESPKAALRLNLGCSDRLEPGFLNVDVQEPCDLKADLTKWWPWDDSSVDYIRAHDIIEHLPDKVFTMNQAWRVLKPGGQFEIVVPTTDGRGAYQDPTHVSFWNRNSFFYFESGNPHLTRFHSGNGVNCAFRVVREHQEDVGDGVQKLFILLEAVKPSAAMAAD